MKISKSLKIYTHIILAFFLINSLQANTKLLNNVVIHDKPIKINQLRFKDVNLQDVDLTGKKGNIMILNFWASWCLPCKREMPSLEKLSQNYPDLKIYPINMEPPNKLRARDFFKSVNVMSLGIYFDPKLELVKKFKMKGLPTSILIDKNGNEFGRVIGEIDFNSEEFKNLLKKYI